MPPRSSFAACTFRLGKLHLVHDRRALEEGAAAQPDTDERIKTLAARIREKDRAVTASSRVTPQEQPQVQEVTDEPSSPQEAAQDVESEVRSVACSGAGA